MPRVTGSQPGPAPGRRQRTLVLGLLVGLLALGVRLAYTVQIQGTPLTDLLLIDSATYDRFARAILGGTFHGEQVYAMNILYPWFLSLVYALGGGPAVAVPVVQAVLGALNCTLVFELGRRLFGPAPGAVAGLLSALYAPFVFYGGALLTPTLINFFSLLCLLLLVLHGERPRARTAAGAGLTLGLAALGRGSQLLFAPLALLPLRIAGGSWRRTLRPALLFLGGVGLLLGGVTIRNYLVEGRIVPVAANYAALYIGHNASATGLYVLPEFTGTASFEGEVLGAQQEVSRRLGRPATLAESSSFLLHEGLAYALGHPRATLRVTWHKFLYFWNDTESPTNLNFYFAEDFSPLLRHLPFRFGLMASLGLLGMVLSRGTWRRTLPLLLFALVQLVTCTVFFVSSEYRLPAVPVLLVFAGFATVDVTRGARDWLAGRRGGRRAVLTALLVLPVLLAFTLYRNDLLRLQRRKRVDYYNFGNLYREKGEDPKAVDMFRRSLDIDPRFGPAYAAWASVEDARGNSREAMRLMELADRYRVGGQFEQGLPSPGPEIPLRERGMRLYREGRYGEALSTFRELEPLYDAAGDRGALVSTRNNIGLCLYKLGQFEEAAAVFRGILEIDPDYHRARTNLALVLEAEGHTAEAIREYRETLEREPNNRSARKGLIRLGAGGN